MRQRNIRRSIHNFRLLSQALGDKDDAARRARRLLQPRLPAFANQDAEPAHGAAGCCPARCRRRTPRWPRPTSSATCSARRSATCGPAPARSGPTLVQTRPFLERRRRRSSRTSCGPFARDALPVVKVLRPAARDLAARHAQADDHASRSSTTCSTSSAYNPPGKEEGYLFWTSWANHIGADGLPHAGRARPDPPRPRAGLVLDAAGAAPAQRPGPAARHAGRAAQPARSERRLHRARPVAPTPTRRRRCRTVPGAPTRPSAARGGAASAEAGSQPRSRSSSWPASRCRASACCSSCGWPSAAPIPLQPKGYRFNVAFKEAGTAVAQRPTCGSPACSVGKVKVIDADQQTGASDATIELDAEYAPIPKDTQRDPAPEDAARRDLRRADAGLQRAPGRSPEDGRLPAAPGRRRRSSSTRSSAPSTRRRATSFRIWMQQLALASQGRGQDINDALGNLAPFAEDTTKLLRILNVAADRRAGRRAQHRRGVRRAERARRAAALAHRQLQHASSRRRRRATGSSRRPSARCRPSRSESPDDAQRG